METGAIVRVEELTRIPADVQDALITILSEKTLPIPELDDEVQARQGFNVIATANNRDQGVNELSSRAASAGSTPSCCRCPPPSRRRWRSSARRVAALGARAASCPPSRRRCEEIRRVVTVFRELRAGVTADGTTKLKSPQRTLSTAEAISVMTNGLALAAHFGDGAAARRRRRRRPASARWSRTRCRTASCGRSTSRRSSATATVEGPLPRLPRAAD